MGIYEVKEKEIGTEKIFEDKVAEKTFLTSVKNISLQKNIQDSQQTSNSLNSNERLKGNYTRGKLGTLEMKKKEEK